MPPDRLARILARLAPDGGVTLGASRLCEVAADIVAVSGAGIMLTGGEFPHGSLCTTDAVAEQIENLQYTLGEGPSVDADVSGVAVSEPDLARPERVRWPAFSPSAVTAGALAVFGFPIRIGTARIGALNLYNDQPGPLRADQHADALVMADVAARAILAMQAAAAAGEVAMGLEAGANLNLVVHQAAGMISVQVDASVGDALLRLRSYAFRTGRDLSAVARDVVARRLRFDATAEGAH